MIILKFDFVYFLWGFFFRVMLVFFLILMECLGLKENMDFEEVVEIIIIIYDLWKCVIIVFGKKKDELWKEKFVIKVNDIILDLWWIIENRIIKWKFFMCF